MFWAEIEDVKKIRQIKQRGVHNLCTSHHVLGVSVLVVGVHVFEWEKVHVSEWETVHVFEWETHKKFCEKRRSNTDCGGR